MGGVQLQVQPESARPSSLRRVLGFVVGPTTRLVPLSSERFRFSQFVADQFPVVIESNLENGKFTSNGDGTM